MQADVRQVDLTPGDRTRELAALLAVAEVRLQIRAALARAEAGSEEPQESFPNCLELPSETRLSVQGS